MNTTTGIVYVVSVGGTLTLTNISTTGTIDSAGRITATGVYVSGGVGQIYINPSDAAQHAYFSANAASDKTAGVKLFDNGSGSWFLYRGATTAPFEIMSANQLVASVTQKGAWTFSSGDPTFNGQFDNGETALTVNTRWSDAADTFTALKVNVTDTNSAAASKLIDLQVGAATRFNVTKAGVGTFASNINSTAGEIQTAGNRVNYNLSAYGAGTAYALTNTAAAIDLGTTDPAIVLDKAGTYLIKGQVHLSYNGATVVAETATVKVRRTNNTAADLSAVVVLDLPVATTLTHSYQIVQIPPFIYTTAATDDAITLFANVSAALGAGSIDATAIGTSIVAVRLY